MTKLTTNARLWLISLAGGVCILLLWAIKYAALLNFHEQMQIFICSADFFAERIAAPTGAAHYVSEFLMQFGLFPWAGAAVVALLFIVTQRLVWLLMRTSNLFCYALSFVPPLLLFFAHSNDHILFTADVAVIVALAAALFAPKRFVLRAVYLALALPAVFWLAGAPVVWIVVVLVAAETFRADSKSRGLLLLAAAGVYALALQLASARVLPYMLGIIVRGVSYSRYPLSFSTFLGVALASLAVVPIVSSYIRTINIRHTWRIVVAECAAFAVIARLLLPLAYNSYSYQLLEYVRLLRHERWQDIITMADEKGSPKSIVALSALNLALAKTNQLGNRLFDFEQSGIEGLIPLHELKPSVTLAAQEVYYHLGMVNEAQRFAFDSMETPSNGVKSARLIKRLAETNLINGDYDVAMKYLLLLRKTLFYSDWASEMLPYLRNEDAINAHPRYGWFRQVRLGNDFLFSETEVDKMIGQLFLHNTRNTLAMQYLQACPLLRRDLPTFMQYTNIILE